MEKVSFWALKPCWCQPWTILLTGVMAITVSWWGLHLWWITLPLAAVVMVWWFLFLVLVPAGAGSANWRENDESQEAYLRGEGPDD